MDIQYHYIWEVIANGAIKLVHCPTAEMAADILTKALPAWKMNVHVTTLGLRQLK